MIYYDGRKGIRITNVVSFGINGEMLLTISFCGGNLHTCNTQEIS
jgi:hypothetical protein